MPEDINAVEAPVVETTLDASPNDNYKEDPRLDENGNPRIEEAAEAVEEPAEAAVEATEEAEPAPAVEGALEDVKFDTKAAKDLEGLIKAAGIDAKQLVTDVTTADGEVSDEYVAKLKETHGDVIADLILDKVRNFHEKAKAVRQERDNAVFKQLEAEFKGVTEQAGSETWKELTSWARENLPEADRSSLNQLLAQGGLAAKLAVKELATQFKASSGYVQSASLEQGDTLATSSGSAPLTKHDYQRELNKLLESGHIYGESSEIAALDNRRLKAIKRGY